MTRKGRRLSPEEEKLWKRIADTATPLQQKPVIRSEGVVETPFREVKPKVPIAPFRIGEEVAPPATETRIKAPEHPLRMDRKTFARIKRGKTQPEARLDLHGMTVEVAHSALIAFLLRSQAEGKRLVLVITGKGREDASSLFGLTRGVLRRQVPHWLEQPPLRQIVLQTTPAHQKHGGSGALYVYLRR